MASRGRGALNRGKVAERAVVNYLKERFNLPNVRRLKAGEFKDRGDVGYDGSPWLIDVKSRDNLAIPAWWSQVLREAEDQNLRPMLIVHRKGVSTPGDWLCITKVEDADIGWLVPLQSDLTGPPNGLADDHDNDRGRIQGDHPPG